MRIIKMQISMSIWHWEWYDRLTMLWLIMIFLQRWWGQWQENKWFTNERWAVIVCWDGNGISVWPYWNLQEYHSGHIVGFSRQSRLSPSQNIMCKCQMHKSQISRKLSHCAVFSKLQLHTVMQLQWKWTGQGKWKYEAYTFKRITSLLFLL